MLEHLTKYRISKIVGFSALWDIRPNTGYQKSSDFQHFWITDHILDIKNRRIFSIVGYLIHSRNKQVNVLVGGNSID